VVPEAGHMIPFTHPEAVVAAILREPAQKQATTSSPELTRTGPAPDRTLERIQGVAV